MLRLFAFLVVSAFAQLCNAQVYTWQPGQTTFKPLIDNTEDRTPESPRRIVVQPQDEPTPALKHRYFDSKLDKKPGNAVANLFRAQVLFSEEHTKLVRDKWEKEHPSALEGSLSEFPSEAAHEYMNETKSVLLELHSAADVDRIDYGFELNNLRGPEVFAVLLPEIQEARQLARLLDVEARLAIAEGRFDDAVQSLKCGFRLAEIVSEMQPSTLIGRLVSIAITGIMFERSLELSQQPNAPNLYWALASVPDSMADMRTALEGESHMVGNAFHQILNQDETSISDDRWQELAVRSVQDFMGLAQSSTYNESAKAKQEIQARLATGILIALYGESSRLQLQSHGLTAEQTSKMSSSEAILRSTKIELEQSRDQFFKWSLLPRSVNGKPYVVELETDLRTSAFSPTGAIVGLLFPAVNAASAAGDRTITKRNQLILLESLRAYASANNGTLPETLESLKPLPVWPHPVAGESFTYQRLSPYEATLNRTAFYANDADASWRLTIETAK